MKWNQLLINNKFSLLIVCSLYQGGNPTFLIEIFLINKKMKKKQFVWNVYYVMFCFLVLYYAKCLFLYGSFNQLLSHFRHNVRLCYFILCQLNFYWIVWDLYYVLHILLRHTFRVSYLGIMKTPTNILILIGPTGTLFTPNVKSVSMPETSDVGTKAVYSCVHGFRPADPAYAICLKDGSWAPSPRCVPGQ